VTEPGLSGPEEQIATAPGDLPMPEVSARLSALEWQFRHDNTTVPLAPGPGEPVEVIATSGTGMRLQAVMLYYTVDGTRPDIRAAALPMDKRRVEWEPRAGFVTHWSAIVPGQPAGTVVRYRIGGWRTESLLGPDPAPDEWAHDGQGFWFRFPAEQGITTFAFRSEHPCQPLPAWMNDVVIYHIFLDRFHPGTRDGRFTPDGGALARHGGTLAGVQQALPYLIELGVSCLWFSPLGPSETYHRYDTMDFFGIDPELGSQDDLHRLIGAAHDAGMRIWLDFVPVHSSWRHPAFQAAQENRSAPTYSWYTFDDWPDTYRNFMQSSHYLPSLNTNDPGARAHLMDAAVYWLQEFDVDGYRLDHVIAAGMDFWVALRGATEAAKRDVVLVGEATDTPDCLRRYRGRLHGILDFPLARALRLTFGAGLWGLGQLDAFLSAYQRYMEDGPGTVSFLDNHDMDRFLWVAGNNTARLKLAAICQFSLRATPVVYYGTEIGMTQHEGAAKLGFGGDAEARADMSWDRNTWDIELFAFYKALIALRRTEPALHDGNRETVHLDLPGNTYAYLLTPAQDRTDAPSLLVAYNLSSESQRFGMNLPTPAKEAACLLATGTEPGATATASGLQLTLAPLSAAILRL